jgi:hypothetical protein
MRVFITARTHRKGNIMETTFISQENGQLAVGVDNLIQLIDSGVNVGKDIII